MRLTQEQAQELVHCGLDGFDTIETTLVGNGRWTLSYDLVVMHIESGKYYKVNYKVGATEKQDVEPFEYDDYVDLIEVRPVEVVKIEYVPVGGAA